MATKVEQVRVSGTTLTTVQVDLTGLRFFVEENVLHLELPVEPRRILSEEYGKMAAELGWDDDDTDRVADKVYRMVMSEGVKLLLAKRVF